MELVTQSSESIDLSKLDMYLSDTGILPILKSKDIFVCGGAILSCLSNTDINDVDLYFPCADDFWQINNFFRKEGYSPSFVSPAAITYDTHSGKSIQLIKYCIGQDISHTLSQFDFGICQIAFSYKNKTILHPDDFFQMYAKREIKISPNIMSPIGSLYRICKYVEKGYFFSQKELFKLAIVMITDGINTYEDLYNQAHLIGYGLVAKFKTKINSLCNGELSREIDPRTLINFVSEFVDTEDDGIPRHANISTPDTLTQETINHINQNVVQGGRHGRANSYPPRSPRLRSSPSPRNAPNGFTERLASMTTAVDQEAPF